MITPIDGGQITVSATPTPVRGGMYSTQYIKVNGLESRPTEWNPDGRPIYDRLPATSQTYKVSFEADGEIGFVYVPYFGSILGTRSLEVIASDNLDEIFIQGGAIVWSKGKSEVNPALLNIKEIGLTSARYFVGYELYIDDEPRNFQYSVTDFSLYGQPLNITASTSSVFGWRNPPSNAFTPEEDLIWKNSDNFFPSYSQPTESYLQWETDLPAAYQTIKVRLPAGSYTPEGVVLTLSQGGGTIWAPISHATVSSDSEGSYFLLVIDSPTFQLGWRLSWENGDGTPYLDIAVDSIEVSGVITVVSKPSSPSPKASLVMYPENTVPKDSVLCHLAYVDINSTYTVDDIVDARNITSEDYVPVADWLTRPWDTNLIKLYDQVKDYPAVWMSPTESMDFEYRDLDKVNIAVT